MKNDEWKPVQGNIMTRWAKEVSPENALKEYPRPQMVRNRWMNLNGLWDCAVVSKQQDKIDDFDGKILVPYPLESALSGVKKQLLPSERLWYRRTFQIPEEWKNQKLLLHFGAVDWETEVYINGSEAGKHTGGYCPFTFEISDLIHKGENEIIVSVWDPTDTFNQERGKQVLKPKGIFYTQVSGIWQTVWMEPVPETFIESVKMIPDIDNETLKLETSIKGDLKDLKIEASVYEDNIEIFHVTGRADLPLMLKIASPKLWSPESPFLYNLSIKLIRDDNLIDFIKSYSGMRKISTKKDDEGNTMVLLNNKPIFESGLLDQGYWPDGLYTAPSDEALRYDIEMAKKMGFNMLRKHIKVEPARWYYYCDLLGMLVWQDMPSGGSSFSVINHLILPNLGINQKDNSAHSYASFGRQDYLNQQNYKNELKEMIDTLHNEPCIITWVPFNEGWGQFNAAETAAWVKDYDPSRLVDHASGWYDQNCGDFRSIHTYIKKLRRPKNIAGRAFVISEFGGYGFKESGHVWNEDKELSYSGYKSKESLAAAYRALIHDQVEPLIKEGLCAVVYTELTDVETEINGIMTYDREVLKINEDALTELNKDLYKMMTEY